MANLPTLFGIPIVIALFIWGHIIFPIGFVMTYEPSKEQKTYQAMMLGTTLVIAPLTKKEFNIWNKIKEYEEYLNRFKQANAI